jgi:hydroxyacylglutathione hydrolase
MEPHGEDPILFCGDTLFSGGCGRLFEGTAQQMHQSLSTLAALPGRTRVCCAHEYTLSNLRFARMVEPGNADLAQYELRCMEMRAQGVSTLPSSIHTERLINPFLRCHEPEVRAGALAQGAAGDDPVAILAALREWKNRT